MKKLSQDNMNKLADLILSRNNIMPTITLREAFCLGWEECNWLSQWNTKSYGESIWDWLIWHVIPNRCVLCGRWKWKGKNPHRICETRELANSAKYDGVEPLQGDNR